MDSSPTASQKKAVRLMINEPDGGFRIEEASPVSQSRKRILIKSPSDNNGESSNNNQSVSIDISAKNNKKQSQRS